MSNEWVWEEYVSEVKSSDFVSSDDTVSRDSKLHCVSPSGYYYYVALIPTHKSGDRCFVEVICNNSFNNKTDIDTNHQNILNIFKEVYSLDMLVCAIYR